MLTALKCKNFRGLKGPLKMDFKDLKGKNGHSPMYSSTFEVKIQNISRSFYEYKITAQT